MNPTSGDASVFLPLEETVLTQTVEPRRRTALFCALQPDRLCCRGTRHPGGSRAGSDRELGRMHAHHRDAADVRVLRHARDHRLAALPATLAGRRGRLRRFRRSVASVARARLSDGGGVRHGFAHQRRSPHLRAEGAHARPSRWYNHPVMAPSNSQNNPAAANDATTNSATMPEGTLPPISGGSGAPIR
jgi:hypothetical protein